MQVRDKDTFIKKCLSAGISVFILLILLIIVENGEKVEEEAPEEQIVQNIDNNVIKEPEDELVKSFYKTKTEDGVSVRIVSYCDGEEKVLTDCEYSTLQFPYYFEKYSSAGADEDIFDRFYEDDFVWEKTIYAEATGKEYTMYYAQEMQHDGVDKEKATGYEGHLWVTDEDARIVKRLFWQSEAQYTEITWEESMLSIKYAGGSDRTCTLEEILKDPAEAVYEKSMQIDCSVKEYAIDTEKVDAMTDEIYKDAYYRALSGQDMVRTLEGKEVCLKEYWSFQGDSNREISDEELGMVQVDEKRYQEISGKFFDAVEYAVTEMTFEEVFGENR